MIRLIYGPGCQFSPIRHASNLSNDYKEPWKIFSCVRTCLIDILVLDKNIISQVKGSVGLIQLNRPKQLNSLNTLLISELIDALKAFTADHQVRAVVLTGNEKAFAAGADIAEMSEKGLAECIKSNFLSNWELIANFRKPLIAALGGGCELAMMCDIIYAGENAKFGQPEIKIGTIPGGGGTQRLIRAIGKSKAMEMILTGRMMDAKEAESWGLVANVLPVEQVQEHAMKIAEQIASFSPIAVELAKNAINKSYEMTMSSGIDYEKRLFHTTFATNDKREGMEAFLEKRTPKFNGT